MGQNSYILYMLYPGPMVLRLADVALHAEHGGNTNVPAKQTHMGQVWGRVPGERFKKVMSTSCDTFTNKRGGKGGSENAVREIIFAKNEEQ